MSRRPTRVHSLDIKGGSGAGTVGQRQQNVLGCKQWTKKAVYLLLSLANSSLYLGAYPVARISRNSPVPPATPRLEVFKCGLMARKARSPREVIFKLCLVALEEMGGRHTLDV